MEATYEIATYLPSKWGKFNKEENAPIDPYSKNLTWY